MAIRWLGDVREEERPAALGAFATLLGLMAGHTLVETARDALFLATLPVAHLPWIYLGIAVVAVAITHVQQRVLDRFEGPTLLAALLAGAAGIDLCLWWLVGWRGPWVFYVLYFWSAVFATVVTVQFWLVLGGAYDVTQAKRLFGFIGAGSVVGAVAGAGVARIFSHWFPPRHMLAAAAAMLLLAAAGALFLMRGLGGPALIRRRRFPLAENLPLLRDHPYLRRVALLVLLSSIAFTLIDFTFKALVKQHVPPDRMASFFATVAIAQNLLSLVAQLGAVGWLVRRLGVTRALWVLPVLLVLGSGAVAALGGLAAVLVLKGADGSLRHSLHRTGVELLYVPMAGAMRTRVKGLMDGLGQRGGQALGSVAILGAISLGGPHAGTALALGIAAASLAWILVAARLTPHYLEIFRASLRGGAVDTPIELPALDPRSLETFIAALSSSDDAEVLAALEVLGDRGRARLIPALILRHPSRAVVLRALDVFRSSGRSDLLPAVNRLLDHGDPEVRAAALAARSRVDADADLLRAALADPSPIVSSTALVQLVASGLMREDEAERAAAAVVDAGSAEARAALARAIRLEPSAVFAGPLVRLADAADAPSIDIAQAMAEIRSVAFVPALVRMLGSRDTLPAARAALTAIGAPALALLGVALGDPRVPARVRRHLPRTISRFEPRAAAPILLAHLSASGDGTIRYKILRGLGRIQQEHPSLVLDREVLDRVMDRAIEESYRALDWRLTLARGRMEDPRRGSAGHELLCTLLRNKQTFATERLFRLLGLEHGGEDFERIHRGLRSSRAEVKASSRELLQHVLKTDRRAPILALVGDVTDEDRFRASEPYYRREDLPYEALLERMLACPSESLRCLAAYHVAEIGLVHLRPALEAAAPPASSPLASVVRHALATLRAAPREEEARAGAG